MEDEGKSLVLGWEIEAVKPLGSNYRRAKADQNTSAYWFRRARFLDPL